MRFTVRILFVVSGLIAHLTTAMATDEERDTSIAVATSELYSLDRDLRLWRLIQTHGIDNDAVEEHISLSILRHIFIVRAANVDVGSGDIKGVPLETLCEITTDEVREILELSGDEEMIEAALEYISTIREPTLARIREVQKGLGGSGCSLTP